MDPGRTVHHPILQLLGPIELLGATGTVPAAGRQAVPGVLRMAAGESRQHRPGHGGGAWPSRRALVVPT